MRRIVPANAKTAELDASKFAACWWLFSCIAQLLIDPVTMNEDNDNQHCRAQAQYGKGNQVIGNSRQHKRTSTPDPHTHGRL